VNIDFGIFSLERAASGTDTTHHQGLRYCVRITVIRLWCACRTDPYPQKGKLCVLGTDLSWALHLALHFRGTALTDSSSYLAEREKAQKKVEKVQMEEEGVD